MESKIDNLNKKRLLRIINEEYIINFYIIDKVIIIDIDIVCCVYFFLNSESEFLIIF